jgi:hypothetical protein
MGLKVAVTVFAAVMLTAQVVEVPEQAPPQPVKVLPVVALAVRVTFVSAAYFSVQSVAQLMPVGLLVTEPFPILVTFKSNSDLKVAVTVFATVMLTVQVVEVPEQTPPQPVKT